MDVQWKRRSGLWSLLEQQLCWPSSDSPDLCFGQTGKAEQPKKAGARQVQSSFQTWAKQTWTKQTWPVTPTEKTYPRNWKDLHKTPWQAELPQNIFCDFPERHILKVHYDSGQLLLFFLPLFHWPHSKTSFFQTSTKTAQLCFSFNNAYFLSFSD